MCVSHLGFDSRTPVVPETDLAMGISEIRDKIQSETQPRRRKFYESCKIIVSDHIESDVHRTPQAMNETLYYQFDTLPLMPG
jgi:hypothetical protein